MNFIGKKVLVIGLGYRTGVSAVRTLCELQADVSAADSKNKDELSTLIKEIEQYNVKVFTGKFNESILEDIEMIILSPGVPRSLPIIRTALNRGIKVIGDIELACLIMPNVFIGITGTDGKSTTTSMIGSVLEENDMGCVAGNIGIPVLNLYNKIDSEKVIALELSSFQLESIETFSPKVAAFLNFAPDHLDRYPDLNSYFEAKIRIFKNLVTGSTAVIPYDDKRYDEIAESINPGVKILTFSSNDSNADFWINDKNLMHKKEILMSFDDYNIVGKHNYTNAASAFAICHALGISKEQIIKGFSCFTGLPHRYEYSGEINGITFINDSKATTITAVATAAESAPEESILLLGGRDKGLDFSILKEVIIKKRIMVYSFGEAADKIFDELEMDVKKYNRMEDAVYAAWEAALKRKNTGIILSPGCTSYDEFSSFEERGDRFKEIVKKIIKGEKLAGKKA